MDEKKLQMILDQNNRSHELEITNRDYDFLHYLCASLPAGREALKKFKQGCLSRKAEGYGPKKP